MSVAISEKEFKDAVEIGRKNAEGIAALTKSFGEVRARLDKTPMFDAEQAFGGRHVRNGEDPMSSRGFSFQKMFGLVKGVLDENQAKVELDVHRRLNQAYNNAGPANCYQYSTAHITGGNVLGVQGGRFLAPLAPSFLEEGIVGPQFRQEMKQLLNAGTDGSMDLPDETSWYKRKILGRMGYSAKALSWLNESTGGALVAPPEQGELIELLRNKEALVNAGARVVPLPPQGRMVYPRQTLASTGYWVGESSPITETTPGTGEVTLQAKKLAVFIKAPNELIRFASPATEALLRDDITKSLALGLDLAGLEGQGGDHRPRGVINNPNITTINSSLQTANGDYFVANDIYRMIAAIEEANAECEAFVMRPKGLYKWYQLRADAVAQGDRQGPFLFNLIREAGDGVKPLLAGYPVVKSTQVSQVRSKGSSSALTYILAGMFSDMLIGMFGAIEFAATTLGDTAFQQDQTWIRGILSADVALRHEAAFVLLDNLDPTL